MIHRKNCRVCKSKNLIKFLDLGRVPAAGGFLKSDQIRGEKFYQLNVYFCNNCSLVQILDILSPEDLFLDYRYLSSISNTLSNHFKEMARDLKNKLNLTNQSFVVEIGCNDGVLLSPLNDLGIQTLGYEPAKNVSEIAKSKGLNIVNDFFNYNTASIPDQKADLIVANNVFAHIDNLDSVMEGIIHLLSDKGTFVFEVHYILDLIQKNQYDTIYHEHLCYYSLKSLEKLMSRYNMEMYDVERIPIHSGSIRVFSSRKGNFSKKKRMMDLMNKEIKEGLHDEERYLNFGEEARKNKINLRKLLTSIKNEGKNIVGYGAAGRATILLNYCNIGTDFIDRVIDESPERVGRYMPGVHIPIVAPKEIKEEPDYILILAWSYATEIRKKAQELFPTSKFIIPLPELKVLDN